MNSTSKTQNDSLYLQIDLSSWNSFPLCYNFLVPPFWTNLVNLFFFANRYIHVFVPVNKKNQFPDKMTEKNNNRTIIEMRLM